MKHCKILNCKLLFEHDCVLPFRWIVSCCAIKRFVPLARRQITGKVTKAVWELSLSLSMGTNGKTFPWSLPKWSLFGDFNLFKLPYLSAIVDQVNHVQARNLFFSWSSRKDNLISLKWQSISITSWNSYGFLWTFSSPFCFCLMDFYEKWQCAVWAYKWYQAQ